MHILILKVPLHFYSTNDTLKQIYHFSFQVLIANQMEKFTLTSNKLVKSSNMDQVKHKQWVYFTVFY